MNYAFNFSGHGVFTPDGKTEMTPEQVQEHNRALEQTEIDQLRAHPPAVFLYVKFDKKQITTWIGTVLCERVWFGNRAYTGFGQHTYRRAVRCELFGVKYHGWFYESSGDYCRLRRSK